jgi:hypothetical protein
MPKRTKAPKKKASRRKRPEKPQKKFRKAERNMKAKCLADFVEAKSKELKANEIDTLAKENLVCPFCGWQHDPDDLSLRKGTSSGLIKCSDCGEAFEFEVVRVVAYTTFVP